MILVQILQRCFVLLICVQYGSSFAAFVARRTSYRYYCATWGTTTQRGHSPSNQRTEDDFGISGRKDTTTLGNLIVPTVGIGTIAWSSSGGDDQMRELHNIVTTAYESDAAFFDTAERYGSNIKTAIGLGWGETETLIRSLLVETSTTREIVDSKVVSISSSPVVIATKFTPTPWRTTVDSVIDACRESCGRLGVEQIDLYQLHMPDIVQPLRVLGIPVKSKDEVYWEGLAKCYNLGLVKNVGVCNYGPTLLRKCKDTLEKYGVPLSSNQIAYSLIGRHNGSQRTVDVCKELDVQVLAYFPFAMGLLTGKYGAESILSSSSAENDKMIQSLLTSKKTNLEIRDLKRYMKGDGRKVPKGGIAPLLLTMDVIAKSRNKTIAQVALNYIICKGAIPIPGARTEIQLKDNLGAMGWRLSDTELTILETEADNLGFGFDGAGFKRTSEKFVGYGVEKWVLD